MKVATQKLLADIKKMMNEIGTHYIFDPLTPKQIEKMKVLLIKEFETSNVEYSEEERKFFIAK